ncbi:MAG: LysM peptidoglycan-binding domain-containing protein [Tetrasphaera sp.]|nr:LysM peptidoglycan-binding domain-containing protein [Tetrasphaera sp.]
MSAIAWEPVAPARPRPQLVVIDGGAAQGAGLPRWGRWLWALALVVTMGWGGMTVTSADAPASHVVTVESGQTLSEIAVRELPGMSVQRAVVALRVANDLSSSQIVPGQQLVIPAP